MRDFCMDLGTYTRHAGLEALQMSILLIIIYTLSKKFAAKCLEKWESCPAIFAFGCTILAQPRCPRGVFEGYLILSSYRRLVQNSTNVTSSPVASLLSNYNLALGASDACDFRC